MQLTGAEIICECLLEQGVDRFSVIRAVRHLTHTTHSINTATESVTFSQHTSRVLLMRLTVTQEQRAKQALF